MKFWLNINSQNIMTIVVVILFDSVYKKDRNYYPKVFLKNLFINFIFIFKQILLIGALEVPPEIYVFENWG